MSDSKGRSHAVHEAPAVASAEYPCAAAMPTVPGLAREAAAVGRTLRLLSDNGIDVRLLVVDFESGLYLRNQHDAEGSVRGAAEMALRCPRCTAAFGREALSGPQAYAALADRIRAEVTRRGLCDPARQVFPELAIGNFYAWPVNRLSPPEGRWPAYGYEESGLNVAMPRVYMNAGWRGAGPDQAKMNWNAFSGCLEGFSPAASVMRHRELLIPWVHVWLGGKYLDRVLCGRKLPEPWVMAEMACHMILRGAETFALWIDQPGPFPADYPYPEYAAMGQPVYDLKGVQAGYHHMLQFHRFLRQAQPINFEVPGRANELGPQTATWSGMAAADKALVRTVAFDNGRAVTAKAQIFGRPVELIFEPRGRDYWVYPDGTVEPAGRQRP
jgi:hypothetical protein